MPYPFDATLKEILSLRPEDCVPVFDLPRTAPAQTLNVDLSTISAATDVAFGFGSPLEEVVDLNFQSGPDPSVPARMHLYNAAFHLRFHVPVRSVLILLRPKADGDRMTGELAYTCGGRRVEFEYDVVRMWQRPVEPFLHGGLGLLPLATLCRMPDDKPLAEALREVVREIDRRLIQECEHPQAVRLMTAAFILTGLRAKRENLASIYQGVRVMHESTAYDEAVEEGCVKTSHRFLLRQGRKLLGSPDPSVESALSSIQDVERLERMGEAILTVKSWEELLSTP
jgi:hypothetical protein